MQKSQAFYYNTGYWFLLLIPLVAIGFYPTYFAVFLEPASPIIHVHFTLMAVWIVILMVQPFLFKYKKLSVHRAVGKFTYVLVPVLLASAFLVIRFSYYRFLHSPQATEFSDRNELLKGAASYQAIAFLYSGWLALLYSLAIVNRRKAPVHARYMVATTLTMLGPTVDRIIYSIFKAPELGGFVPIESIAFVIADSILAILLWKDYKSRKSTKALAISLAIFLSGQIIYFSVRNTTAWASFVSFLMQTPG